MGRRKQRGAPGASRIGSSKLSLGTPALASVDGRGLIGREIWSYRQSSGTNRLVLTVAGPAIETLCPHVLWSARHGQEAVQKPLGPGSKIAATILFLGGDRQRRRAEGRWLRPRLGEFP